MLPLHITTFGWALLGAVGVTLFGGAATIIGHYTYEKYNKFIEITSYDYAYFGVDVFKNSSSDNEVTKQFLNELDNGKRKADNYLKIQLAQNKNETNDKNVLAKLRRVNDYSFRIFRDMWFIQNSWMQRNGRYFQGKDTLRKSPRLDDVGQVQYEFGLTDQVENWTDVGYKDKYAPVLIRSDVYEAPQGHGYKVTISFEYKGSIYSIYMHKGPDRDRWQSSYEWQKNN